MNQDDLEKNLAGKGWGMQTAGQSASTSSRLAPPREARSGDGHACPLQRLGAGRLRQGRTPPRRGRSSPEVPWATPGAKAARASNGTTAAARTNARTTPRATLARAPMAVVTPFVLVARYQRAGHAQDASASPNGRDATPADVQVVPLSPGEQGEQPAEVQSPHLHANDVEQPNETKGALRQPTGQATRPANGQGVQVGEKGGGL